MLEGISLYLAIESFSFLFYLYHIFCENDGKENCAQVLEEECIKMFGTKILNDEHVCNVVCWISGSGKTLKGRTLGCARRCSPYQNTPIISP